MSKNADPPLLPSADPSAPHMANTDQRAALTAALLREVDPDLWHKNSAAVTRKASARFYPRLLPKRLRPCRP